MDWLTFDFVSKILIPICTFALGVVVTLATKRIERRRSENQEHVKAIAKLTNDWYNQLHQLSADIQAKPNRKEAEKSVYFYVHNRIVLPDLLLRIEYLEQRKVQPALLQAVKGFLALVTTFGRTEARSRGGGYGGAGVSCVDVLANDSEQRSDPAQQLKSLLYDLDVRLQEITKLSAHALAK